MNVWRSSLLLAFLSVWSLPSTNAQTVTFDFDTGTPVLPVGRNTPLEQTSGGITARFGSPNDPAFSVQTDASTSWRLSRFSGKYLSPNSINRNPLYILFSGRVTGITFTFATADFEVEVPTTMQLTAYLDSTSVGSVTAHGTYAGDTMPMGTLTFNSGGRPFNAVEIVPLLQTRGATAFLIDNVVVTPMAGNFACVSAASYLSGAPVAPGSIVSGFGQGLASGTEAAASQPLPTTLANTTVAVKDSAGAERQAPLFYVGPTQINYLVPESAALGLATLTVTSAGGVTATGTVNIDRVAPGLFTANFDGKGAPAAVAITVGPDLTQTTQMVARCGTAPGSCVTSPIDLGSSGTQVALTLYGTGMRGRSSLAGVTARIGGVDAQVMYAGAQAQFAGLDQVNVVVPRALAGQGEVDLAVTLDAKAANTVRVNIK